MFLLFLSCNFGGVLGGRRAKHVCSVHYASPGSPHASRRSLHTFPSAPGSHGGRSPSLQRPDSPCGHVCLFPVLQLLWDTRKPPLLEGWPPRVQLPGWEAARGATWTCFLMRQAKLVETRRRKSFEFSGSCPKGMEQIFVQEDRPKPGK